MDLQLRRIFKGETYTIGRLYINGEYFCDTIEDTVRSLPSSCPNTPKGKNCACSQKVYEETAIPAGEYKITMEYSPRSKRVLPFLHDVHHFIGILIHSGNDEKASAGCIIVGKNKVKGKVLESRATSDKLNDLLKKEQSITIYIS